MTHYPKYLLLAAALTAFASTVFAEITLKSFPGDTRMKYVRFEENNVIPLHAVTFTTTQILFGKNETVMNIEGGDTAGWMVTYHANLPNMVFIKPTVLGSNANITIVTSKHSYYFHAMSNDTLTDDAGQQTYAIRFTYPEDEAKRKKEEAIAAQKSQREVINPVKNPEAYNWNYRFSGSAELTPIHVFDDGTFTYFELTKHQAVPAIFAVDDRTGKEAVVNTRREGNYLVVQRTAPQFTLRNGRIVTSVFNINEIARIRQGRRPA